MSPLRVIAIVLLVDLIAIVSAILIAIFYEHSV